jgi:type IV secretory pathway TrbF-like protein
MRRDELGSGTKDETRLAGGTLPMWMHRGAEDRLDKRWWRNIACIESVTTLCSVLACIYFANLPRQVAVPFLITPDGHWSAAVITETVKVASEKASLTDWITGCRSGDPDPYSMAAQHCSALLDVHASKTVADAVHEYNDQMASSGMRPTVFVHDVAPSNDTRTLWRITWDERHIRSGGVMKLHAMWADVTVARSEAKSVLHDPLLNPYGLYVTSVRVVDEGEKK